MPGNRGRQLRVCMNSIDATYRPMRPMPKQRVVARPDQSSKLRVGLAVALLYLLLVPQQFNPTISGFYLSPYRIYLIGATLYLLSSAFSRTLRFAWPDLMIVLAIAWITLASYVTSGTVETAMVQGGSHFVDIGLAYFLARAAIQTPTDLRRFLILVAPGVAFTGVIVFAEAVSHRLIVQAFASAVTGNPGPPRTDVRLGFMRGMSSFPHPILCGIFLASFLPIYFLSGLRGWPRIVSIVGSILGAFTMSSAAMLGLVVGFLLFAYDWLSERIHNFTWKLFLGFSAAFYVIIESSSNTGFYGLSNTGFYGLLVRYASLNSTSAYNRVLIWKYGTQNIIENPWFGIGYGDWDRPEWLHSDSFDWFWLILGLRFGIPAAVLILGATLLAIAMLAIKSQSFPPSESRLLRGVAISLAVFSLGLNSVSLWMSSLAWFFMLLGLTVTLATQPSQPIRPKMRRVWVPNSQSKAENKPAMS